MEPLVIGGIAAGIYALVSGKKSQSSPVPTTEALAATAAPIVRDQVAAGVPVAQAVSAGAAAVNSVRAAAARAALENAIKPGNTEVTGKVRVPYSSSIDAQGFEHVKPNSAPRPVTIPSEVSSVVLSLDDPRIANALAAKQPLNVTLPIQNELVKQGWTAMPAPGLFHYAVYPPGYVDPLAAWGGIPQGYYATIK